METKKIQELLTLFRESGIARMELEEQDFKLKLDQYPMHAAADPKQEQPQLITAPKVEVADQPKACHQIKAPLVGTFYASMEANGAPLVKVGDVVKQGDVLCIIEAMKVMNEICADQGGTISSILAGNEDMVQYGQALFELV